VSVLVYAAVILGLGMALSRAGIFLAVIAALASLLLVVSHQSQIARHGVIVIGGATLLGAISVVQFALFNLLGRFDDDILADYRVRIAQTTIDAAKAFQPFGSGFGTFVPAYQMFERTDALLPAFVNHAHNDWLELWLEGSWPALAILGGFLVWLAVASVRMWRRRDDNGHVLDRAIAQAGSIVIVLLLLHSVVDYPLHTTALMTLFAFCCALLKPPHGLPATLRPGGMRPHREKHQARWHGLAFGTAPPDRRTAAEVPLFLSD
jgi:O-antigen ligase